MAAVKGLRRDDGRERGKWDILHEKRDEDKGADEPTLCK
jgi:hypothetical protein